MDPKLFEEKLSEVCEWRRERHHGQTHDSVGRNEVTGDIPTYIAVSQIKDRPCPYNPQHKNCDITIKATAVKQAIYVRRCRSCRGIIVRDQWYDGSDVLNTAKFTERILFDDK